jgi:hypothetical protein
MGEPACAGGGDDLLHLAAGDPFGGDALRCDIAVERIGCRERLGDRTRISGAEVREGVGGIVEEAASYHRT